MKSYGGGGYGGEYSVHTGSYHLITAANSTPTHSEFGCMQR